MKKPAALHRSRGSVSNSRQGDSGHCLPDGRRHHLRSPRHRPASGTPRIMRDAFGAIARFAAIIAFALLFGLARGIAGAKSTAAVGTPANLTATQGMVAS